MAPKKQKPAAPAIEEEVKFPPDEAQAGEPEEAPKAKREAKPADLFLDPDSDLKAFRAAVRSLTVEAGGFDTMTIHTLEQESGLQHDASINVVKDGTFVFSTADDTVKDLDRKGLYTQVRSWLDLIHPQPEAEEEAEAAE